MSVALRALGGGFICPELSALQSKQLEFHLFLSFSGNSGLEDWAKASVQE